MRILLAALVIAPTLLLASGCTDVKGKVVLNVENANICTHPPETFVLQVQTGKKNTSSDGVTVDEVRTVCVDAGLAGAYPVGSNYP